MHVLPLTKKLSSLVVDCAQVGGLAFRLEYLTSILICFMLFLSLLPFFWVTEFLVDVVC